MANSKNLANGIVLTPPSPNTSGTSIILESGYGSTMPATPFFLTLTPPRQLSTMGNSEIVEVTARSVDTLTVTRAQKGTTAQPIAAGWVASNGVYVENIDADTVDGYHANVTPTLNTIPVLDGNAKLPFTSVPSIAFKARRNTAQSSTASASISFIPNALYYNFGGGYDTATGLFTAPIDGVYSFKANAFTETTPTTRTFFETRGTANTGNAPAGTARGTERSNDFDSANLRRTVGTFETYMYAGETFGLNLYTSHSNALSNLSTWFSGHLVAAA